MPFRQRKDARMASTKHLTAVVVEDDCDQRALAATLLEETEFDVIECDSAEAALDIVNGCKIGWLWFLPTFGSRAGWTAWSLPGFSTAIAPTHR